MSVAEAIGRVITEIAALVERLLEEWVDLTNVTQATNGNVTWYFNISLSTHVETFTEILDDLVSATLGLTADITSYLA